MAQGRFDLNEFNRRVVSALERREAQRLSARPPTLIERLKAVKRQGQKLTTLPRL